MCVQCRVALHSIISLVVAYEIGKDSLFGINAAIYKKWRKYSEEAYTCVRIAFLSSIEQFASMFACSSANVFATRRTRKKSLAGMAERFAVIVLNRKGGI